MYTDVLVTSTGNRLSITLSSEFVQMCREMTAFTSSVYLRGRFKNIFKFRDCSAVGEKVRPGIAEFITTVEKTMKYKTQIKILC